MQSGSSSKCKVCEVSKILGNSNNKKNQSDKTKVSIAVVVTAVKAHSYSSFR